MRLLLVISHPPHDGTDVVWNALRLAKTSREAGLQVQLFLMNEGVDLARQGLVVPEGYFDLGGMLRELMEAGAAVKLCQTCLARCGIGRGDVIAGAEVASMGDLVAWIRESEPPRSGEATAGPEPGRPAPAGAG